MISSGLSNAFGCMSIGVFDAVEKCTRAWHLASYLPATAQTFTRTYYHVHWSVVFCGVLFRVWVRYLTYLGRFRIFQVDECRVHSIGLGERICWYRAIPTCPRTQTTRHFLTFNRASHSTRQAPRKGRTVLFAANVAIARVNSVFKSSST
ncbi:hypothetical protein B0H66DRAFT_294383 [Apodospora peruviana]|uniref:Uncharacterized protein n=1 Tax=Apodospora peruviana TaxID=516989 RepID=A0AAE0I0T7_9PEZI|nr:hypothetical protein B0H66DRAFT_294383 [Apodospora peruviana]